VILGGWAIGVNGEVYDEISGTTGIIASLCGGLGYSLFEAEMGYQLLLWLRDRWAPTLGHCFLQVEFCVPCYSRYQDYVTVDSEVAVLLRRLFCYATAEYQNCTRLKI